MPTAEEVRARLPELLSPKRIDHVQMTVDLARMLARIHGVDLDRAELTALLHDIAAGYSNDVLLAMAEDLGVPISVTEARIPRLLHGKVGAEMLRREWGITDDEMLDAVRYHITGHPHMSVLAKVIFVADKLEPNRDRHYGGLDPIREIARRSLDEAMLKLYAWRMDELVSSGQALDENLVASRNRLIEYSVGGFR
jgi:predicted HD superfamily hydrolase involved in NAD metabolism